MHLWMVLAYKACQLGRVDGCHIIVNIVFDFGSLAQIEHYTAILAAAERDVIALSRLMEAQSVHRDFDFIHLSK